MQITTWINALNSVIFPAVCHCCGNALSLQENWICTPCRASLPTIASPKGLNREMEQRFAGIIKFHKAAAMYRYTRNSAIATLFQDFKYRGYKNLAKYLGALATTALDVRLFFSDIDIIIPVPIHWSKKLQRGYNQTVAICHGISQQTGIPIKTQLIAQRPHKTQTRKNANERRKNLHGVFKCKADYDLNHLHIAIVDDVCTTGATLAEAATTVLQHYPKAKISIFALATTYN